MVIGSAGRGIDGGSAMGGVKRPLGGRGDRVPNEKKRREWIRYDLRRGEMHECFSYVADLTWNDVSVSHTSVAPTAQHCRPCLEAIGRLSRGERWIAYLALQAARFLINLCPSCPLLDSTPDFWAPSPQ